MTFLELAQEPLRIPAQSGHGRLQLVCGDGQEFVAQTGGALRLGMQPRILDGQIASTGQLFGQSQINLGIRVSMGRREEADDAVRATTREQRDK